MFSRKNQPVLLPIEDRGPLKVMFLLTSMPVGGAEILLTNLIRRLDSKRFQPELCCLKSLGPLGEELSSEVPAMHGNLRHKFDVRIALRLAKLLKQRRIDALITVGCGDKMFWGRIAAHFAGTPVVVSALHSTGWPDGVGRLNRLLTPWTDAFIAVAEEHGRHLIDNERFPKEKVHVIPNGVDTNVFRFTQSGREAIRKELRISIDAPVAGIVAALRPEKNHELFLKSARRVLDVQCDAHFMIIGDGERRESLASLSAELKLTGRVHFLGTRRDTREILSAMDVFCLTSKNEANPVSILEALATSRPVVATNVGSVAETVQPGITGFLAEPGNSKEIADHVLGLFEDDSLRECIGAHGRDEVVSNWSLDRMIRGYEELVTSIYRKKALAPRMSDVGHQVARSR